MRRRAFLIGAATLPVGALVLTGACSGGGEKGPPEIVLGRTECEQCHMIITELRFAGAYRTADGTEHRFDDIGDMVEYAQQNGEVEGSDFWVFDHDTEEPLLAKEASFVRSEQFATPMDWALAAFAEPDAASAFVAERGGEVLSWAEVQEIVSHGERREPGGESPVVTAMPPSSVEDPEVQGP